MPEQNLLAVALDLPLPAALPVRPFNDLAKRLNEVNQLLNRHSYSPPSVLREAIPAAEALLAECAGQADSLRDAMEPMSRDELKRAVAALLAAWPNASNSDIAGFGAAAMADLIERKPCRRAVHEGFRELRQTSRFLPSIAEILATTDRVQARLRSTSSVIAGLPAAIVEGKARLADQDRHDAEVTRREALARERREADGKSTAW